MFRKIAMATLVSGLLLSALACSAGGGAALPPDSSVSEGGQPSGSAFDAAPPPKSDSAEPEQPDPTLPENQHGPFYKWDHVEYQKFGDISTYLATPLELRNHKEEDAGRQAPVIGAEMLLPANCKNESTIHYDGGFANGTIKIGGGPSNYYVLGDGETIKENRSPDYDFEFFTMHPLTGEKYTIVETQENQVGGYYQTEKWMRYIGRGPGVVETHLLQYVIDLGHNTITSMYFYVSPKATAEDLKIYGAIADSVKVVAWPGGWA